jgi:hypothetical protein
MASAYGRIVALYAVGQLLGHKTPRMTQRYAHLAPEYMAGAVGKLDGIMGGILANSTPSNFSLVSTRNIHALNDDISMNPAGGLECCHVWPLFQAL